MKITIDLPEDQLQALAEFGKRMRRSRSALVAEAIAEYLEKHVEFQDETFGVWKDDPVDGLEYQTRIRSEWR